MSVIESAIDGHVGEHFHHEAFLYRNDVDYVAHLQPFISEGVANGDAVLVAVPAARLAVIRDGLDVDPGGRVRFEPMEEVGRNPAWIIPVWAEFFDQARHDGRAVRGVGEPIWADRSDDELVEYERHEALLNLAFAGTSGFQLLCPYDAATLDPDVIAEAHRTHPQVSGPEGSAESAHYVGDITAVIDAPLSPVPEECSRAAFDRHSLGVVRRWAAEMASGAGLSGEQVDDLMVGVSEAMTNSIRHAGGSGELLVWQAGAEVLCEVRDGGHVTDPLAGRVAPSVHQLDGRGLWIMNRVCDLVQIRDIEGGQAVRLHFSL
jgi:anti-sigma regulatory factor (Ser/Thr protein kinase)